jgi:IS5 family transposase
MITYDRLADAPDAFLPLTGLARQEFDGLFETFTTAGEAHRAARTHTKRGHSRLKRAAGAGHPHDLDPRTRVVLTLVWLRVYPSYAVLGVLFGVDKPAAWHAAQDVLEVLETMPDFPFERPGKGRTRLGTTDAVMAAFPAVRAIIDAKEQGVRRPAGWEEQKPFYSGKKRRHTVKNQVVCTPTGRIGSVSKTAPGRTHDLTVLRYTGVLDELPAGAGVMTDKGYVGVEADAGGRPVVIPAKGTKNHPLTDDQKASNRVISRHRVVVEHVMAQLNRFGVLRQTFRSVFGRHTRVFRVVALSVDRRMAVAPLKTYPAAA